MTSFSVNFKDLTDEEFANITDILAYIKDDRSKELIPKEESKMQMLRYLVSLIKKVTHEDETDIITVLLNEKNKLEKELFEVNIK